MENSMNIDQASQKVSLDKQAEQELAIFLERCSVSTKTWPRVRCSGCHASRYLYCCECCKILIPEEDWPLCVKDGSLQLPFCLDVLLDDHRGKATGPQAITILHASGKAEAKQRYKMFDQEYGEVIPAYENDPDGVFVLFPGPDSMALSSVLASGQKIKKLVVLDCKWTQSIIRLHPSVQALPKVHLDSPYQSFFWRWHNAGQGMLSSIEAVFYASWCVASYNGLSCDDLVQLLWIFGLQRELIRSRYESDGGASYPPHLPFTEKGKEYQRELRNRNK